MHVYSRCILIKKFSTLAICDLLCQTFPITSNSLCDYACAGDLAHVIALTMNAHFCVLFENAYVTCYFTSNQTFPFIWELVSLQVRVYALFLYVWLNFFHVQIVEHIAPVHTRKYHSSVWFCVLSICAHASSYFCCNYCMTRWMLLDAEYCRTNDLVVFVLSHCFSRHNIYSIVAPCHSNER